MGVKYYFSSIAVTLEMNKHQSKIEMILDAKKISYEKIDVASDEAAKEKMRKLMGDPKALPPQLFNDDTYLGDADAFEAAIEEETLEAFLKVKV